MRAWTMLAIGLTLLIGAMPGVACAQATGEIGGPPTMGHLPFPPPHNKKIFIRARSEPIVIGVGFSAFGKVEIVGQDSDSGLCISIDHPKQDMTFESCGEVAVPPRAIAPDLLTWRTRRHRRKSLSDLSGFMQPTVASVTAVAHQRKGRKRTRKAVSGTVAVPSPDLLARLHQSTSFGFFAADFRGCLENAKGASARLRCSWASARRVSSESGLSQPVQRGLPALRARISGLRVLRRSTRSSRRRPLTLGRIRSVAAPVLDQVPGSP
jgi:hypothetical protein